MPSSHFSNTDTLKASMSEGAFSPSSGKTFNSERHSIESLYTVGDDEIDCPFLAPVADLNSSRRSDVRVQSRRVACKTKLQSSFDEEGTPVSVTCPKRQSRAEYNRSIGSYLQLESEKHMQ